MVKTKTVLGAIALLVVGMSTMAMASPNYTTAVVDSMTGHVEASAFANQTGWSADLGSVHVNGNIYSQISMSGEITNWTGYTHSGSWDGTWAHLDLYDTNYLNNPNSAPAHIDQSYSGYAHYGDTNYGNGFLGTQKQMGYNSTTGLCPWLGSGYIAVPGGSFPNFIAEDTGNPAPGGYRQDFPQVNLANPTQFAFNEDYNIVPGGTAGTCTMSVSDIGGASPLQTVTIGMGYPEPADLAQYGVYDNYSNLVMSAQQTNNMTDTEAADDPNGNATGTYGYDYNMQMTIHNVLAGDANLDGKVDGADFLAWQNNFGMASGGTWSQGDFNNDGKVDGADFLMWQNNFGADITAGASAAVPEPATLTLLGLGAMGLIRRRRSA